MPNLAVTLAPVPELANVRLPSWRRQSMSHMFSPRPRWPGAHKRPLLKGVAAVATHTAAKPRPSSETETARTGYAVQSESVTRVFA